MRNGKYLPLRQQQQCLPRPCQLNLTVSEATGIVMQRSPVSGLYLGNATSACCLETGTATNSRCGLIETTSPPVPLVLVNTPPTNGSAANLRNATPATAVFPDSWSLDGRAPIILSNLSAMSAPNASLSFHFRFPPAAELSSYYGNYFPSEPITLLSGTRTSRYGSSFTSLSLITELYSTALEFQGVYISLSHYYSSSTPFLKCIHPVWCVFVAQSNCSSRLKSYSSSSSYRIFSCSVQAALAWPNGTVFWNVSGSGSSGSEDSLLQPGDLVTVGGTVLTDKNFGVPRGSFAGEFGGLTYLANPSGNISTSASIAASRIPPAAAAPQRRPLLFPLRSYQVMGITGRSLLLAPSSSLAKFIVPNAGCTLGSSSSDDNALCSGISVGASSRTGSTPPAVLVPGPATQPDQSSAVRFQPTAVISGVTAATLPVSGGTYGLFTMVSWLRIDAPGSFASTTVVTGKGSWLFTFSNSRLVFSCPPQSKTTYSLGKGECLNTWCHFAVSIIRSSTSYGDSDCVLYVNGTQRFSMRSNYMSRADFAAAALAFPTGTVNVGFAISEYAVYSGTTLSGSQIRALAGLAPESPAPKSRDSDRSRQTAAIVAGTCIGIVTFVMIVIVLRHRRQQQEANAALAHLLAGNNNNNYNAAAAAPAAAPPAAPAAPPAAPARQTPRQPPPPPPPSPRSILRGKGFTDDEIGTALKVSDSVAEAETAIAAAREQRRREADEARLHEAEQRMARDARALAAAARDPALPATELSWEYIRRLTHDFDEGRRIAPQHHADHPDQQQQQQQHRTSRADAIVGGAVQRFIVKLSRGSDDTELRALMVLRHANVIPLVGFARAPPDEAASTAAAGGGGRCATVEPLRRHGDLTALLRRGEGAAALSWRRRLYVAQGIANGLAYIHHARVLHHDVKSSNVVITDEGQPQLIDFEVAKQTPPGVDPGTFTRTAASTGNAVGTPGYMCPQYAQGLTKYTAAQDVFGFGVVLLELLTGVLAVDFFRRHAAALFESPDKWQPDPRRAVASEDDHTIVDTLRETARMCLASDPRARPSLQSVTARLRSANPRHTDASETAIFRTNDASAAAIGAAAADEAEVDTELRATLECVVHMEADVREGEPCSGIGAHFVCAECIEGLVVHALDTDPNFFVASCPVPGCQGRFSFARLVKYLPPDVLLRWQEALLRRGEQRGHQQAESHYKPIVRDVKKAEEREKQVIPLLNKLQAELNMACPHCHRAFIDFSGCVAITCNHCSGQFCGLCIEKQPCREHQGAHHFRTAEQVADAWKVIRQRRVDAFFANQVPKNNKDVRDAVARAAYKMLRELDLKAPS